LRPAARALLGEAIMGDVLIVESDQLIRGLLTECLEDAGYTVLTCSCESNLPELRNHPIALIIADIALPKRRCTQIVDRLRQGRPDTPIIVTSAHFRGVVGNASTAKQWGANRLLAKPFSRSQLLEAVAVVLRSTSRAHDERPPVR